MSPAKVEALLRAYYMPGYPETSTSAHDHSDSAQEARRWLVERKAIHPHSNGIGYDITAKGDAWVKAILETPEPVCIWQVNR